MIKNIPIKELTGHCVDLLMKTYTELGQTPSEQVVMIMSQSLANDLKTDFDTLDLADIQKAFSEGVRNTDKFSINVKTYYYWIKKHRQLIWSEEDKSPEMQDKRLRYRTRKGTGTKSISGIRGEIEEINKTIKEEKKEAKRITSLTQNRESNATR